jgi:O-antigen ligase
MGTVLERRRVSANAPALRSESLLLLMRRAASGCWSLTLLTATLNAGWNLSGAGGLRAGLHIYAFDVPMLATLVYWALSLVLAEPEVPRAGPRLPVCALGGLVLLCLLGAPHATHVDVALGMTARLWILFLFYLYTVNHPPVIRSTAAILALGLAMQGAVAVGQVVQQHAVGLGWMGERMINPAVSGIAVVVIHGHRWLRPYGLTLHPNVLGGVAACCLLMLAAGLSRRTAVPATLACVAVLGLTLSRGAILAGAIAVLVYWRAARRPFTIRALQFRFIIPIAVLCAVPLVATPAGSMLASRFDPGNSLEQQSIGARLTELDEAWTLLAAHPLIGVGANGYLSAIQPLLPPGIADGGQVPIVHNAYLVAFTEVGFAGPLLLALALLMPAWHTLQHRGHPSNAALAAALAACAVLGLADYYVWSLPGFRLLWATLLALWAAGTETCQPDQNRPNPYGFVHGTSLNGIEATDRQETRYEERKSND